MEPVVKAEYEEDEVLKTAKRKAGEDDRQLNSSRTVHCNGPC